MNIKALALAVSLAASVHAADALLVVAHGAKQAGWNDRVIKTVDRVEWPGSKAVAFLAPSTPEQELANAAARLDQPGVDRIIVVPLLISSYSEHYEEIRYYTGERTDEPDHAEGKPLKTRAALVLRKAMDADPLVSAILADQIRAATRDAAAESVVLVAHGPNEDADNERWLACLLVHAGHLKQKFGFRRVEFLTLRDDASPHIRMEATAALQLIVKSASTDSKVLVQPVLISVGHVQSEIAKRLDGLAYTLLRAGVSEHALAAEWIRRQAEGR